MFIHLLLFALVIVLTFRLIYRFLVKLLNSRKITIFVSFWSYSVFCFYPLTPQMSLATHKQLTYINSSTVYVINVNHQILTWRKKLLLTLESAGIKLIVL